jgi:hypothetical protein
MKMKLFTLKMEEGGSALSHISVFKEIVADLVSMEVKYEDEDLDLLLLCSLPNSFASFRDTILLSRDELPSWMFMTHSNPGRSERHGALRWTVLKGRYFASER